MTQIFPKINPLQRDARRASAMVAINKKTLKSISFTQSEEGSMKEIKTVTNFDLQSPAEIYKAVPCNVNQRNLPVSFANQSQD